MHIIKVVTTLELMSDVPLDPYWPDKPYTICGEYYHSLLGGHFTFDERSCWPEDKKVDCIWVVMKYEDNRSGFSEAVSLQVTKLDLVAGT